MAGLCDVKDIPREKHSMSSSIYSNKIFYLEISPNIFQFGWQLSILVGRTSHFMEFQLVVNRILWNFSWSYIGLYGILVGRTSDFMEFQLVVHKDLWNFSWSYIGLMEFQLVVHRNLWDFCWSYIGLYGILVGRTSDFLEFQLVVHRALWNFSWSYIGLYRILVGRNRILWIFM